MAVVRSQSMACTRSALLERRPDLPLCTLRRVHQLCVGNSAMYSSTGLDNAARDTRSLLQTPLKVASLPRRDQIAIGKAIVGRLGKDDNWVTNSTAGWTFAAATTEMPEGCRRPVSVEKLRQVSRRVSRGGRGARQGRSAAERRKHSQQAQAEAISGLIGDRELTLMDARYRLATSESRASTAQGMSSSITAAADEGSRRRRPKTHHGTSPAPAQVAPGFDSQDFEDGPAASTKRGEAARKEPPEGRPPAAAPPRNEGSGEVCTEVKEAGERRGKLSGVPCVPSSGHDVNNKGTPALPERDCPDRFTEGEGPRIRRGYEGGIGAMATTRRSRQVPVSQLSSSRRPDVHGGRSLMTCGSINRKPRPPKQRATAKKKTIVREEPQRSFEDSGRVQGGRMVPQRQALDRGPDTERGQKSGRVLGKSGAALHRGLVITNSVRAELLNPMSHRFKLLRR